MTAPNMVDPMDIDPACPPYQEESFVQTLEEPLQSMVQACLEKTTEESSPAAARMDSLEIALRSQLLELSRSLLQDTSSKQTLQKIQDYWKSALQSCLHLVYFSTKENKETYVGLGAAVVRKLPFLLLEDIVETLPLHLVLVVWSNTVEPSIPLLCGGDNTTSLLWVKTSHLIWIRLCNKLLRKSTQGDGWAGDILKSLATVFPLSERSAVNVLGSFHTDNVTQYESLEEFEQQKLLVMSSKKQDEEGSTAMDQEEEPSSVDKDYGFYQTFWSVQQDFSNPNAIAEMSNFTQKMQTILSVLESQAAQIANDNAHETVTASSTTPRHSSCSKYLTNSQLLHLQLRDAEVRIHFLTQYLIIESYLQHSVDKKDELTAITVRAKDLLRHTPPHGPLHLKTLEWLLDERESMWRKWKKNKCTPDLEKKSSGKEVVPVSKSVKPMNGTKDDGAFRFSINVKKDLPAISRALVQDVVPRDVYSHLEDYVAALDPDAGIEAEYHPKNDNIFCWRSMRLLARSHLGLFGKVRREDGDFEGLVRHIYKHDKDRDIPGDAPEPNADPLEEHEEPGKMEAEESQESLSDDISVGSPMEAEETKNDDATEDKAAKAEFERAALEEEEEIAKQEEDEKPENSKKGGRRESEHSPPAKNENVKEKEDAPASKKGSEKVADSPKRKSSPRKDSPKRTDSPKQDSATKGDGKGESASKDNQDERPQPNQQGRDSDHRGNRDRRQGGRPSPGRYQGPPDRGNNSRRSSPDRGGRRDGRRDDRDRVGPGRDGNHRGGGGRDGGGRGKRDRGDGDDHRRGSWGAEDRGGKRGRHGGGRRSY